MKVTYVMVFVSDMSRSVAFYRDVAGMPLKFESPEWTEFSTEGATLALHKSDDPTGNHGTGKFPGVCSPGFSVPDLKAYHQRMVDAAVPCMQPPRNIFGTEIAQYQDPDGLLFSVSGIKEK